MSVKHNLEQWIAQLDYDDTCDISDWQVSELIRNYAALEARCAEKDEKLRMINELIDAAEQVNKLAQETTERLIQERNALAAENAGLKSIQEWAVADVFKTGAKRFESTKAAGFDTDDCLHDAVLVMLSELQTPATDAFLAEVRAQGVDMAACALDDVNQFNYANMLDDLAQKIRQEAAQ